MRYLEDTHNFLYFFIPATLNSDPGFMFGNQTKIFNKDTNLQYNIVRTIYQSAQPSVLSKHPSTGTLRLKS